MLRVAIAGASGRMGRTLIEAVLAQPDLHLSAALEVSNCPVIGQSATAFLGVQNGILISSDLASNLTQSDVLIDFTRPAGTLEHLSVALQTGCAMVIGTTGFSDEEKLRIEQAAKTIPIVFAPNMSVGVNVTLKLLEVAAKYLSEDFDVEIFEAHHSQKIDAPSGTAIAMGEVIAKAQGKRLEEVAQWTRHGNTGKRIPGSIGFSVLRAGDIIGDHITYFAGNGERIEIAHKSSSRATYAQGSLRAARFLVGKPSGLFDMQDVLGLSEPQPTFA